MYYLQTRYYDPEIGQFISPDSPEYLVPDDITGLNLYAYCGYNPVMNVDPTGTSVLSNSTRFLCRKIDLKNNFFYWYIS